MYSLIRMIMQAFSDAGEARRSAREDKYQDVRVRQLLQDADRRRDEHAGLRRHSRDRSEVRRKRRRQRAELDQEVGRAGRAAYSYTLIWGLLGVAVAVFLALIIIMARLALASSGARTR